MTYSLDRILLDSSLSATITIVHDDREAIVVDIFDSVRWCVSMCLVRRLLRRKTAARYRTHDTEASPEPPEAIYGRYFNKG